MTDQLVFSLLLGPECFWLVLQKVSHRNRIWREECEVLSIALLLRVPQPCTGRAQKGCFWLAAGCLQAPAAFHPAVGGGWHGGCGLKAWVVVQGWRGSRAGAGCGGSPVMDHASPAAAAVCLLPLRSTSRFMPPSSPLLTGIRVALHSSCLFKRQKSPFLPPFLKNWDSWVLESFGLPSAMLPLQHPFYIIAAARSIL